MLVWTERQHADLSEPKLLPFGHLAAKDWLFRQTDRQTDRQTEAEQTDSDRQTNVQTDRWSGKQADM